MNAILKRAKGQQLASEGDNAIWVMTTEDIDLENESVSVEGGDLSDFNGVVVDNHQTDGPISERILGRVVQHWTEPVGEGTHWPQVKGPSRMAMLAEIEWNLATEKGREAKEMSDRNMLTGGSISFAPEGKVERNRAGGRHFPRWKLLEFSLVTVPANPSAIRLKRLGGVQSFDGDDGTVDKLGLAYAPGTRVTVRQLGEGVVEDVSLTGNTYWVRLSSGHLAEVDASRLHPVEMSYSEDDEELSDEDVEAMEQVNRSLSDLTSRLADIDLRLRHRKRLAAAFDDFANKIIKEL